MFHYGTVRHTERIYVMDLNKILKNLENCACGREHKCATKVVRIESGLVNRVGEALTEAGFPKKLLFVADNNTLRASEGIVESLEGSGFVLKKIIYDNMMYAKIESVNELKALCGDVDGIISVGTGSLNDICRVTAFGLGKRFCIFATAPSMDGFASDTAPIIENNFKESWKAEQPEVILADTKILANSPLELKAAGFGDMVAKYIGLADWRISELLTGEYYCPAVAKLTEDAIEKIVSLADKVGANDEEAAGAIMEALVLSGIAMKLALSSRPASGAEHVVSHYLECYKLARGIWPEFHGKKVGVATVFVNRLYRNLAERLTEIEPHADDTNWDDVYAAFSPEQIPEVKKLNTPTITDKIDVQKLKESWPRIREIIFETLPTDEKLMSLMKVAGAATELEEINVSEELFLQALKFHPYMRYRVLVTRLAPMLGVELADYLN